MTTQQRGVGPTRVPAVTPSSGGFVGRSEYLAALAREFALARQGSPRTMCIQGESGIGKTLLVREFLRTAGAHRLVWASGSEAEQDLAYGVTDQIAAGLRALGRPPVRRTVTESREAARPWQVGATLLRAIGSDPGPMVVVVDDLHWVDAPSAAALLFLLRRLRTESLLVVVTGQPSLPDRMDHGWRRLLTDPAAATLVTLEGLTPREVGLLARASGQALPSATALRLHRHTGGHPLHLWSLLQEVGPGELARSAEPLPAPRSLATVIKGRLDALPAPARDLVAAGAVLGPSFAPAVAAAVAEVPDPASALDRAREAGLLHLRAAGAEFPRALVHAAVYHGLEPARRRSLHRRAAEVTSGTVSLQHRAAAVTGYEPALADELMAVAVRQIRDGDYPQAVRTLQDAARLAEALPMRERIVLQAVALMSLLGDSAQAERFRPAVQACAEGAQRTFTLGVMALAAGRPAQARALLQPTLHAPEVPDHQRTRAAVALALTGVLSGEAESALAAADVADAGSLDWERSVALFAAVLALAHLGHTDRALRRARDFRLSDPSGPGAVDAQGALGMALMLDGDLPGAVEQLGQAARRGESGEPSRLHELALTNLADAQFQLGRWDQAGREAEVAVTLATGTSRPDVLVRAHGILSRIASVQGRFDDAEDHLRQAEAVPSATGDMLRQRLLAMARAVLADARGLPADMLSALAASCGGRLGPDEAFAGLPGWRLLAVQALVEAGPPDQAAEALTRFERWLSRHARPSLADDAARLRGELEASTGDVDGALAAYRRGLRCPAGPLRSALSRGRLHAAYGHLLAGHGSRRDAIEQLRAARSILLPLRAAPFLARCDADLVACGLPAAAASGHDPLLLTAAERRVAHLVAQGLTNRDTAQRLYLSTKTVEYHLSHVFAKLGITSRAQIAQALGVTVP